MAKKAKRTKRKNSNTKGSKSSGAGKSSSGSLITPLSSGSLIGTLASGSLIAPLRSGSMITPLATDCNREVTEPELDKKIAGLPAYIRHLEVPDVGRLGKLQRGDFESVARSQDGRRQDVGHLADRINWAEKVLGIPWIWNQTKGRGVTVAVLDTGIDQDHPDLKDAIVGSMDFTNHGLEDVDGHGTHCAGVIAARQNDVGFVGVAPEANLLVGKVLGNDGRGNYDWIAAGVDWAVDQGARVISMSLGGPSDDHGLFKAVHRALAKGVFVICAAGNDGTLFQNSVGFPGRYGGVITVASHDENGNPSGFSSRGGEVDFMAPGDKVWSTFRDGGYAVLSGTSMATPFVAGLSALMLSKHLSTVGNNTPMRNNEELREHLMRMATHPGWYDPARGYGVLQPFQYFGS